MSPVSTNDKHTFENLSGDNNVCLEENLHIKKAETVSTRSYCLRGLGKAPQKLLFDHLL